jgi:hypothetical protein
MTTKITTILFFGAVLFGFRPCLAQQNNAECSTVYENHNQIDYGPLKVAFIEGTSAIQVGPPVKGAAESGESGVPGACFVLFTEKDHKLVTSVKADSKGRFELRDVGPGRYRLVARAEGFCTANIPLEVVKSSGRPAEIRVYFRFPGIDVCSTGELAPKPEGSKSVRRP